MRCAPSQTFHTKRILRDATQINKKIKEAHARPRDSDNFLFLVSFFLIILAPRKTIKQNQIPKMVLTWNILHLSIPSISFLARLALWLAISRALLRCVSWRFILSRENSKSCSISALRISCMIITDWNACILRGTVTCISGSKLY